MIKLNLKRPLAFFDIESTGVNVASDRIVEIAILKINVDGSEELKTKRINPGSWILSKQCNADLFINGQMFCPDGVFVIN
jgi:DNA polymerase III epsilon subunit-like protein